MRCETFGSWGRKKECISAPSQRSRCSSPFGSGSARGCQGSVRIFKLTDVLVGTVGFRKDGQKTAPKGLALSVRRSWRSFCLRMDARQSQAMWRYCWKERDRWGTDVVQSPLFRVFQVLATTGIGQSISVDTQSPPLSITETSPFSWSCPVDMPYISGCNSTRTQSPDIKSPLKQTRPTAVFNNRSRQTSNLLDVGCNRGQALRWHMHVRVYRGVIEWRSVRTRSGCVELRVDAGPRLGSRHRLPGIWNHWRVEVKTIAI